MAQTFGLVEFLVEWYFLPHTKVITHTTYAGIPSINTALTYRTIFSANRSILSKCRNDRSSIEFQPSNCNRKESRAHPRDDRGLLSCPPSKLLWILLVECRNSSIPRQSTQRRCVCGYPMEILFHENTVLSTEFPINE